jgi:O-antigen ligase
MFTLDLHWQFQHLLNPYLLTINLVLIILAVAIGYLAYKKTSLAVATVAALLPTYLLRTNLFGIPITYLEVIIIITFASWLIRTISRREPIHLVRHPLRWPIALLLIAATIGFAIAPDLRAAAGLWKAYVLEPCLLWVVISNLRDEKKFPHILYGLGLGSLLISMIAIAQWFTGFGIAEAAWIIPAQRRVTSIFTSPNAVGLYLGPIIILCAGWLIQQIRAGRQERDVAPIVFSTLVILLGLTAIIFTKSDGTVLGLMAAAVFVTFFGWSKRWTTVVVVVAVLGALLISPVQRLIVREATFASPAGQNRLTLWHGAWQYLASSPTHFILGAGIHGFPAIQDGFRDPLKLEPLLYPHNIFLNFWVEYGLLGLIAILWLWIAFFRTTNRQTDDRWLTLSLQAAMIAIIMHGLVDVPYFKNDLAVLFWILLGLVPAKALLSTPKT